MEPKEYLKNCTDQELFQFVNGIDFEIEDRLIDLLKSHGCTVVYFPENEGVMANVNDIYGTHKWGENEPDEKWIDVEEVGYATILDNDNKNPQDYLYVIAKNQEQYSNDEINGVCMWDLYHAVKEIFEK